MQIRSVFPRQPITAAKPSTSCRRAMSPMPTSRRMKLHPHRWTARSTGEKPSLSRTTASKSPRRWKKPIPRAAVPATSASAPTPMQATATLTLRLSRGTTSRCLPTAIISMTLPRFPASTSQSPGGTNAQTRILPCAGSCSSPRARSRCRTMMLRLSSCSTRNCGRHTILTTRTAWSMTANGRLTPSARSARR